MSAHLLFVAMTSPSPKRGRPANPDARAARIRQIVEGARRCFARKGFHAASTAEISAEAGVSVANLYQYFPAKDDLVLALVEDDLREDLALLSAIAAGGSFREGLRHAAEALLACPDAADRSRLRMDVLAEAARNPAVAAAVIASEAKTTAAVAQVLARFRDTGELAFEGPPEVAATLVMAFVDGLYCRVALLDPAHPALGPASDDFLLRALGATAPR
jgi:AcrR family transcriptional regulator